jgi:hypothetical protein
MSFMYFKPGWDTRVWLIRQWILKYIWILDVNTAGLNYGGEQEGDSLKHQLFNL